MSEPAQDESSRILCGDALEAMATLREASVDALITDPPYCSGAVGETQRTAAKLQGRRSEVAAAGRFKWFRGDNMTTAGLSWLLRGVAFEACRVVKAMGHFLCFMDWRLVPHLVPAIESAGLRYQGLIVWDKGSMGLGVGFRARHEHVGHFTLGSPEYHDRSVANVIKCPRVGTEERDHATEKPVDLLRLLLRVTTPPGGLVLDPFAGSGTTGVAARGEGRRFVLVERDRGMCEKASTRCSLPVQAPLFKASELAPEQVALFDTPPATGHNTASVTSESVGAPGGSERA